MRENTVKGSLIVLFVSCFILFWILASFSASIYFITFLMGLVSILFLRHKFIITFSKKILLTVLFLICFIIGYEKGMQFFFQSMLVFGVVGVLIWKFIKDPNKGISMKTAFSSVEIIKKIISKPQPYFLGKGTKIEIGGYILEDPLIYVVDSKTYEEFDASLLCLRQPVGFPQQTNQRTLPYWPSLSNADPNQVATYVNWLATGRKDPNIELGYVFICFYGLERRALVDRKDILDVGYEVIRLLGIYGNSGSFRNYATGLLIHLILLGILMPKRKLITALMNYQEGYLSETFQTMLLGYLSKNNIPLPDNWAFYLAKQDERVVRSVVLTRASEEFQKLFTLRYNEKCANQLIPKSNGHTHWIEYRAASPTLLRGEGFETTVSPAEWPVIVEWKKQFSPVVKLFNDCIEELKAYSRKTARSTIDKSKAFTALPSDLQQELKHPQQDEWDKLLESYSNDSKIWLVPVEKIADLNRITYRPKISLSQSEQIARFVESFGLSIEPDPRYTEKPFQWKDYAAILRLPDKPYLPETKNYALVSVIVPLAIEVSLASGELEEKEQQVIVEFLQERFMLTRNDRLRLDALIEVSLKNEISLLGIKYKIQYLFNEVQCKSIGKFLVMIAGSVSGICPKELEALEKIFVKVLWLSKELVKEFVNELGYTINEAERLSIKGIKGSQGEVIPPRVAILDINKIRKIREESIEASKLLIQAMEQSASEASHSDIAVIKNETVVMQNESIRNISNILISNHIKPFFQEIITKEKWPNDEVNALARKHKVTISAALEEINTWSDENLGDFLIEEGDNLTVNKELLDNFGGN
ncbi:MAG: hypothetical protein A2Y10_04870 [Planctomycetes bacterium GWF2_41_51]|nr:MAG: hypothetical protein A2Y10_04870 [Planctomycetes bacterium GWF2_41_51]HBG25602.1 hypothetical protein [Phycisphaerales bacterium]